MAKINLKIISNRGGFIPRIKANKPFFDTMEQLGFGDRNALMQKIAAAGDVKKIKVNQTVSRR